MFLLLTMLLLIVCLYVCLHATVASEFHPCGMNKSLKSSHEPYIFPDVGILHWKPIEFYCYINAVRFFISSAENLSHNVCSCSH